MKQLYKGDQVSPLLHPIDARAWINLGWSETKHDPVAAAGAPALLLINRSLNFEELEVLPSIGSTSAERIFKAKPSNGYESLKAVALVDGLSRVDWDAVNQWNPET
ncbi:MAG: hypothetical protein AAF810_17310 [Cyanobacteria bacterium P01_D01_bin.36]